MLPIVIASIQTLITKWCRICTDRMILATLPNIIFFYCTPTRCTNLSMDIYQTSSFTIPSICPTMWRYLNTPHETSMPIRSIGIITPLICSSRLQMLCTCHLRYCCYKKNSSGITNTPTETSAVRLLLFITFDIPIIAKVSSTRDRHKNP